MTIVLAAQSDTTTRDPDNFVFITNVARLTDAESYAIAPSHVLRRANSREIKAIKSTLKSNKLHPHHWEAQFWERSLHSSSELLPEEEWRYFIIARDEDTPPFLVLERALDLSPLELEAGLLVRARDGMRQVGFLTQRVFQIAQDNYKNSSFFVEVSSRDVDEIRTIYSQLIQWQDVGSLDMKRFTSQLSERKCLPHRSELRFLGYFALFESLLTHPPKPSDPYDSITRQVKINPALLDRRFLYKIDYAPFGGATADAVWSKMYEYRSLVAHGGSPQFTGQMKTLGNAEVALRLIKETVKAVIHQALSEPHLVADLRDC